MSITSVGFLSFFRKSVSFRKDMLNYSLRLLNTGEPKVRKLFKDRSFKSVRVLRLLDKIWYLKVSVFSEEQIKKLKNGFEVRDKTRT